MHSMGIDRRRFLALLLAAGGTSLATPIRARDGGAPLYLAARKREGRYEAAVFDASGADHQVVPLPDRGHSFAIDARRGRAVAFGRQPGFFAIAFDLHGRDEPRALELADERHFFGHGVYTPDGKLLFATENDYEAGRGVLGIYDASDAGGYKRVGECPTGGIGPHEVVLMPDGRTLCVANGGILTHPDYGKLELNLDTMRPSLAYVDARSGRLLEQVFLPQELYRLSLRHMALDASGAVWVGCQYMGPAGDRPALVARHRRGEAIRLFSGPPEVLRDMRNYVGSVAADASGRIIATSSPVGGCVVFWDAGTGGFLRRVALDDGCGVAPAVSGGFLLSSGLGAIAGVGLEAFESNGGSAAGAAGMRFILPEEGGRSWDNHMRKV
ncbi:DUF1513 domain-containing protein [Pusillimonas noertemannii]|uniref:DUF1513 domain-containing protein n=1 Tax=Pusillimonas noertemannii TaxID=305977 RepID=A0A2U1CLT4_9BURK|nr:DUF1513 domain-containing protein [Pusillimonas noertemannii]NYT69022.1 DUF1513 domain-containing protein [Pusillimonas noertemannii]PVY61958.1 hypothetical protein C7440_1444 [Pusillimonas noertemannii]